MVFDTGSEYLAVTSSLCDDKTSGNFKFKKFDPLSGSFVQRDQLNERCKTEAYDMHKSDSNKILWVCETVRIYLARLCLHPSSQCQVIVFNTNKIAVERKEMCLLLIFGFV